MCPWLPHLYSTKFSRDKSFAVLVNREHFPVNINVFGSFDILHISHMVLLKYFNGLPGTNPESSLKLNGQSLGN